MRSNYQKNDHANGQARSRTRNNRARYDNDDRYVGEYRETRARGRASRDYDEGNYVPRRRFSLMWVVLPLLSIAVAALGFGVYHLVAVNKPPVLAQITAVTPNYKTIRKPYNSCHKEATTTYVANEKNGTNGALIGGATGAVAGGIIGNQFKQGGGGTLIGAVVGGATGALAGREIQRSNQPDYVAKHGSTTKCATLYKSERVKSGSYTVQYTYNQAMATIVTNSAPQIGAAMPIAQLQALAAAN